jgi:acetyl-CoA carboxylase biotin carboxyl carrier protein
VEKHVIGRELHWESSIGNHAVHIEAANDHGTISIDGEASPFQILDRRPHGMHLSFGGKHYEIYVLREGRVCTVWFEGAMYRLVQSEREQAAHTAGSSGASEVRAPMAGKVLRVEVRVDSNVAEHETLVILESMKMETSIQATRAGHITELRVKPGDVVDMGDLLAVIE